MIVGAFVATLDGYYGAVDDTCRSLVPAGAVNARRLTLGFNRRDEGACLTLRPSNFALPTHS